MTTFYICRHGQTENNKHQRFSGWIDSPLTDEGVHNAISAAAKVKNIPFDKIISSDLGRAFITAYIISREVDYSSEIERLRDLREVNYGDFANQPYEIYPEHSPVENADYVSPNGESLAQMQKRVLACLNDISSNNQDKTILAVAHDGLINAVRAQFNNESIGIADLTHNSHDFVAKVVFDSGEVISFEETLG